ncbi:MAG: SRPBCC family protein, partial [Pseudonocardia sp.]|nr:SRPBCC family protein [Pseudonocardia sp.]
MTDRIGVKNQAGTDPTEALKAAGERLVGALMQRAVSVATDRVGDLSERLTDAAAPGGPGLRAALAGGTALAEGRSPLRAVLGSGLAGVKERFKGALGGGDGGAGRGGGGGKKLKVTNIVESVDVGLPLRTTYDLWTRFTDFPSFLKKVEMVEQPEDERTSWKAQVFWSHRTWEATIVEQVPDSHIIWRSKAAKGRVDGAVTFTELGRNLTRVLVVLEYWPQGLFERTGNLWRAQGRRARLELKNFRRHAMTHVLAERREVEG